MANERAKKTSRRAAEPPLDGAAGGRVRSLLLAALVALCVARPLLPSEAVSYLGDGQPFCMFTVLLACGCLLLAVGQGGLTRRLNALDVAVGALIVIMVVSDLAGAGAFGAHDAGTPRYAVNMLWEWTTLGLIYFLARQLVVSAVETRAIVAVMFALAVVLALFGFYQVAVSLPADRAAFVADPDGVMKQTLGQAFPEGSPERMRFENRLNSSEPLATFALTNSLAGMLAPWLIVGLGIALAKLTTGAGPRAPNAPPPGITLPTGLALGVCWLAVAACLLLTKSRSAYVAVAVGGACLPLCVVPLSRRARWKVAIGLATIVLLLVVAGVMTKGLDREVWSEAGKSLGYRLEYWQATLSLIGHYPWLGVGSGNFQDFYTQFKLPQSSEEIRDPHNFLLEVWATGGSAALVALVAILVLFSKHAWHIEATGGAVTPATGSGRAAAWVVAGAGAGVLLAFLLAPLVGLAFFEEQLLAACAIGGAVIVLAWRWMLSGTLPPRLLAVGVLVMLIHWLAAGGIAYPGVAGSFWLLLALAVNQQEPSGAQPRARASRPPWGAIAGLGASVVAAVACYLTSYRPVLACQAAMTQAGALPTGDVDRRLALLKTAALADPLSAEPWLALAEIEARRVEQNPQSARALEGLGDATAQILSRRAHSEAAWRQLGNWHFAIYRRGHEDQSLELATRFLARAVELYPNFAPLRAELALAFAAGHDDQSARREAAKALELDALTPHADKKLPPELRTQVAALAAASR